jgi:hypothetical protein
MSLSSWLNIWKKSFDISTAYQDFLQNNKYKQKSYLNFLSYLKSTKGNYGEYSAWEIWDIFETFGTPKDKISKPTILARLRNHTKTIAATLTTAFLLSTSCTFNDKKKDGIHTAEIRTSKDFFKWHTPKIFFINKKTIPLHQELISYHHKKKNIDTIPNDSSNFVQSDSNFFQSDSNFVQSDSNFVQPDSNFVQSDSNFVQSDSNFVQSDSNFVQPDSNFVQSDSNFVQSDSNVTQLINSGVIEPIDTNAQIEAQKKLKEIDDQKKINQQQQEELKKKLQKEAFEKKQQEGILAKKLQQDKENAIKKQQEELIKKQKEEIAFKKAQKEKEALEKKLQEELLAKKLQQDKENAIKKQQEELIKKQKEEELKKQQEEEKIKKQQEELLAKEQADIQNIQTILETYLVWDALGFVDATLLYIKNKKDNYQQLITDITSIEKNPWYSPLDKKALFFRTFEAYHIENRLLELEKLISEKKLLTLKPGDMSLWELEQERYDLRVKCDYKVNIPSPTIEKKEISLSPLSNNKLSKKTTSHLEKAITNILWWDIGITKDISSLTPQNMVSQWILPENLHMTFQEFYSLQPQDFIALFNNNKK